MTAQKKTPADLVQGDEEQVQLLLARRQAMAEELHLCTSRAEAEGIFAPIFALDEATQMALLKGLVRVRDSDAADLMLAMHELAPAKTVRKEARRTLIQLAGAKVYPSWTPEPEATNVVGVAVEQPPRFWKGQVAEIRETGEMEMILCWEQGVEYNDVRMLSFLLDFWREGVKDFFTETGTRTYIERRIKERVQMMHVADAEESETPTSFVDCTLAEGRRLLDEALDVNRWRKTEPHKDFRQALPLVQRLILHATEVGEDRGTTFISRDLEADMVAANFAGAWSMGDYSLCYDLLSRENPVLEGQSRDEWLTTRRAWADEAQPARFEMYFLREHEPQSQQSALWLPTSVLSTRTRNASKEIALGWSLALRETQLSGTLPEMQMGTAVYKETGRYWFWTVFTLEQVQGEWRIARIKDEGAAIQALPVEELEKRIQEHDEAIQKIMREHRPNEADGQQYYEEILWRSWQSLSLADALLVKKPQEKALYESAYGRAMSLRAVERAAVYADALVKRFPDDPDHKLLQQQLGAVLIALSERFAALHLPEQAGQFREQGETTLRATLSQDDPLSYLLVSELLIGQQKYEEAERLLLDAREVAQEEQVKVQIESDLAHLAITLKHYPEAQQYLERVAALTPNEPGLWYLLGSVQRQQNNLAEAEASLHRSLAEEPNEIRAYGELASLYLDQRELEKAIDILGQGLRLAPQFATLHALMAIVYVEKGDLRRAREYLNSAEALDPEMEILPAISEAIAAKKK